MQKYFLSIPSVTLNSDIMFIVLSSQDKLLRWKQKTHTRTYTLFMSKTFSELTMQSNIEFSIVKFDFRSEIIEIPIFTNKGDKYLFGPIINLKWMKLALP